MPEKTSWGSRTRLTLEFRLQPAVDPVPGHQRLSSVAEDPEAVSDQGVDQTPLDVAMLVALDNVCPGNA
jgi:hypothetical protein